LSFCLEQYIQMETDYVCRRCSLDATVKQLTNKLHRAEQQMNTEKVHQLQEKLNLVKQALHGNVEAELASIKEVLYLLHLLTSM
jgi:hypothetical protein